MPKEYRTIQEVSGPLMLVREVEGVKYNELGEIELANGETRRCRVLEIDGTKCAVCANLGQVRKAMESKAKYGIIGITT